jgi:hypothetical protein
VNILITIDTECDNAWQKSSIVKTENVRYLPRFQSLCEKYNFKTTYLATYEIVKDKRFVEFGLDLIKRGKGEIGCHPHAWNSPPQYNLTSDDFHYHPYLIEYPQDIIRQKVEYLTKMLEDTFGVKMISHRAGRWAMNNSYAKILAENGYRVDCSITPYILWPSENRGTNRSRSPEIDYRNFPSTPYFWGKNGALNSNSNSILEIPVTIIRRYTKLLYGLYSILPYGHLRGGVHRLFGQPTLWFRPHRRHEGLNEAANTKLNSSSDYIMFMLHSSEMMPGGSPNFKTIKDIDEMYAEIEKAFELLANRSTKGLTCFEYYKKYTSQL